MYKRLPILTAALLGTFSTGALSDVNWQYVEAGYSELDAGGADADGFTVAGKYLMDNNIYLNGDYKHFDESNVDFDMLTLGAGYRMPLTSRTDAYFGANFERVDTRASDDSGFSLNAGIRSMIMPELELAGQLGYYDVDDGDVTFKVSANYYFTPRWAVGLSHEGIDDVDITQLTARYAF
ncbi:outer membrane beta-barrel protein [Salinimonas chungwhensis]|uniref:outer membrane beta-barrel protein n=1 Tax=Salinimonas chungwhensis TaxID=265425 RepID=UPI000379B752|nr:outer membrane beta-barrel protein [Salinimonas chungwhensis]